MGLYRTCERYKWTEEKRAKDGRIQSIPVQRCEVYGESTMQNRGVPPAKGARGQLVCRHPTGLVPRTYCWENRRIKIPGKFNGKMDAKYRRSGAKLGRR
jgi:hypothetical protein